MKVSEWKLLRVLVLSAFALLCFGVGYLAPHRSEALAQSPGPQPTVDDVPGGGGGHGHAMVKAATATQSALTNAHTSGWPCAKDKQCKVTFRIRMTPSGSASPLPFDCKDKNGNDLENCFAFIATQKAGFEFHHEYPRNDQTTEEIQNVNIAGMFQLQPTK
jgi:hypothetical protein